MLNPLRYAIQSPKRCFQIAIAFSTLIMLMALLPSILPQYFPFLHALKIDTDPENMLSEKEEVRLFHQKMKKEFALNDILVVGVINPQHPQGVFNSKTLKNIQTLSTFAKKIRWQENGSKHGVIESEIIAPSTVDSIEQDGLGSVRFEWLMKKAPKNDSEALFIAQKAKRLPFLDNTLISDDGKALALYFPIYSKKDSYIVAEKIRQHLGQIDKSEQYLITGLPIAQDQFGVEMFKQMLVSAPLAMLLIFALMWYFFRNLRFITVPMIVALLSVIIVMSFLVVCGFTIHIMSSMIPIFIMPIAVLDAVHILSDFFDRYPHVKDRRKTLEAVMHELKAPMLYTSLTTSVGFGSLLFTPIPPVQIFGAFIALGVFFAYLLTITLVPAYIILMPEKSLINLQLKQQSASKKSFLSSFLELIQWISYERAKTVLLITLALLLFAIYGLFQIQINDNPVKWFEKNHKIRIADKILNDKFAGTYMAYLSIEATEDQKALPSASDFANIDHKTREKILSKLSQEPEKLQDYILEQQETTSNEEDWENWEEALLTLSRHEAKKEIFKHPDVLRYLSKMQSALLQTGLIGKSNAVTDLIKTVHRELFLGQEDQFRIPDSPEAVAQTLITYQSSHRPQDLWHFVNKDYRRANIWLQLKSGDNKDMQALVRAVESYIQENPAPFACKHDWFGLTYINVIWQEKMVWGMLEAFLGSFFAVFVIMTILFRSLSWAALSMIPLLITIAFIYGIIGIIAKDYDMPVAVLSALSLGLAVDYAIHFLQRSREMHKKHKDWALTLKAVFGEPARAIVRNVIVVGMGFLPLLASPLIPYQTVGIFISAILLFAGIATLFILPALLKLLKTLK